MPIDRSIVTKKDIEAGYDAIAEKMYLSEEFYDDVLAVKKDYQGDILEAGVGQGVVLKKIAERGGSRIKSLIGLDLSTRLLEMAKMIIPQAKLVKGDVEAMPFADKSFDLVMMVGVFQYVLDADKTLKEVKRVLRLNGEFIVTVPNRKWILFKNYIKQRRNIQPVEDRFFDFEEMKELLEKHGFSVAGYRGADALRFYGWKHKLDRLALIIFPFLHKRTKHLVFRCIVKS